MLDVIQQFIEKYYINPIIYDTGNNFINTITWLVIILISIFLALKLFSRMDVKIDDYFIIAVAPYIIFGSTLRVLEDTGTIQPPLEYLLLTPIVYEVTLLITVLLVLLTKGISQRLKMHDWQVLFGGVGIVLSISTFGLSLSVRDMVHPEIFLWILGVGTGLALIIYSIFRFFDFSLMINKLNAVIIWAHILNTQSTFIWLNTIFHEEHKWTYIVLPVLWILDTKIKNRDVLRNLLKLSILFLGLAPATRNTLRLVLGI